MDMPVNDVSYVLQLVMIRQLAVFGVKKLILFDNGETAMQNLRLELEDNYKDLDFVPVN